LERITDYKTPQEAYLSQTNESAEAQQSNNLEQQIIQAFAEIGRGWMNVVSVG
jgi:hypothetical protein